MVTKYKPSPQVTNTEKRLTFSLSDKQSNEKQNFKTGVFKKYIGQNVVFANLGQPNADNPS